MKKRLENQELTATEGPMNAVALDDAMVYLGLDNTEGLTEVQEKTLRAKKKKIVKSSKKQDRRVSRELQRRSEQLGT